MVSQHILQVEKELGEGAAKAPCNRAPTGSNGTFPKTAKKSARPLVAKAVKARVTKARGAAKPAKPGAAAGKKGPPAQRQAGRPEVAAYQQTWADLISNKHKLSIIDREQGLTVIRLGVPRTARPAGLCCIYFITNKGEHYLSMVSREKLDRMKSVDFMIPHGSDGIEMSNHLKTAKYAMDKIGVSVVATVAGFWVDIDQDGHQTTFRSCANYFNTKATVQTRQLQDRQTRDLERVISPIICSLVKFDARDIYYDD
ncbi:hypothetical protein JKP88DRAFT_248877 [Tribonema minus]|uniref:Uncharacterized protein n=1 Tax=Tribonema minus TaxID=303371 RepID=A0A835YUH5_9STRA|nr:hypothetical protein JKP88DRAFT_248877 [Tribonema minus]